MTLSPKNYKAALLASLVGLIISSQQSHAAGLFSKKPEPVHLGEVVKEINSHGLSRLCSAGTAKSKLSRSDFRYRQKGNKNHDEYLIAWILCAYNADSDKTPNEDFRNSTYGKTIQAAIGGAELNDGALNQSKRAVKLGRPAKKLFCALDKTKLPKGHIAEEVIEYCLSLTAAEKQGVQGQLLTQDAELIPMEDEAQTRPTQHVKLGKKELGAKKMPHSSVKLGDAELDAKKLPQKSVKLGAKELAAKKTPHSPVITGALRDLDERPMPMDEYEVSGPTQGKPRGKLTAADKQTAHAKKPLHQQPELDVNVKSPQTHLKNLKVEEKIQTPSIPSVDEIKYGPKIEQILRKTAKLNDMDIYDASAEILRFENLLNFIHSQNKPKAYTKHAAKIQKLLKPVMDKVKPYLDADATKSGNFGKWFNKKYPEGKPLAPSRENRPWPPKPVRAQQPTPMYDLEQYRGASFDELDAMEEPGPEAYKPGKKKTADEILEEYDAKIAAKKRKGD